MQRDVIMLVPPRTPDAWPCRADCTCKWLWEQENLLTPQSSPPHWCFCAHRLCAKPFAQCTSLLCRSSAGAAGSAFPAAHRGQCGPAASEGGSLDATRLLGLEAEIPEYNIATCLPFENIQREKRRRDEPSPDSPSRVSPIKIVPSR